MCRNREWNGGDHGECGERRDVSQKASTFSGTRPNMYSVGDKFYISSENSFM